MTSDLGSFASTSLYATPYDSGDPDCEDGDGYGSTEAYSSIFGEDGESVI